uniref:hypothetical protein n=1 Tax=uncultured Exiguobacterium sp. TaxID=202669 RepID=UPI00374A6B74
LHKVFDLLVVVTEVTIDEACASFVFVFRRIRFLPHRSVFKVRRVVFSDFNILTSYQLDCQQLF